MARWTTSDMPWQKCRSAVVTGAGGLGFETALEVARAGAEVIIVPQSSKGFGGPCKSSRSTQSAIVRFEQVDLASLKSVADFAVRVRDHQDSLDLPINNAAVMSPPRRQITSDGFELQFGTSYLEPFALTAHLMPLLREGLKTRVVTLSSIAARNDAINLADLQAERIYNAMPVYSQSKLACLTFALELQLRSDADALDQAEM